MTNKLQELKDAQDKIRSYFTPVEGFYAGPKIFEPETSELNYIKKFEYIKRAYSVIDVNVESVDDFKEALKTYKVIPIEGWLIEDLKYAGIVSILNQLKRSL